MDLKFSKMFFVLFALVSTAQAGVSPAIPAARRTEYFFIANDNLGYKYGYDTGSGIYAKQVANAENQVIGLYAYPDSNGDTVVVNYRSGPEGFIPEGYEKFIPNVKTSEAQTTWQNEALPENKYKFSYSTSDSSRQETSDELGKKEGQYSFQNNGNKMDVTYSADGKMGFKMTNGNTASKQFPPILPVPGLPTVSDIPNFSELIQDFPQISQVVGGDGDKDKPNAAYSFQYSNPESSREESSDANGNIKGQYSYTNNEGTHDLSYIAGPGIGFQPTGGSLAQPNGINGAQITSVAKQTNFVSAVESGATKPDGAYSFQYSNPESSRAESSDASGNVRGQYAYINTAGTHDLTYIAGPRIGFQPTGGSLVQLNGLQGNVLPKTIQPSFRPTTPDIQYAPSQTKLKTPTSYISNDEVTVEKFFPPGQHGKTGYVIRYNK